MIKLKTEVEFPVFGHKIGYRHQSVMIGSCFAENIGLHLQERCFPITVNPSGILFNPSSIATCLKHALERRVYSEKDLVYHNNLYHSYFHHSRFSGTNTVEIISNLNQINAELFGKLEKCSHLFITFGTSWVFRHQAVDTIVSNCHKLPSDLFEHYRLTTGQILEEWVPLVKDILSLNPSIQIIFTVSPIRHLKNGAHGNQLSKSTLLIAIDELISRFDNGGVSYFPSYELLLDELRDYRYYASDMMHPSEVAIALTIEKFESAFIDEESKSISSEIAKAIKLLNHNYLNHPIPDENKSIRMQIEKLEKLKNSYPFIIFDSLIKRLYETSM